MDTFSLSLSLGSISKTNKYLKVFPFLVGIFHFFMPLFGNILGITIMNTFNIASNIAPAIINAFDAFSIKIPPLFFLKFIILV